MPHIDFYQGLNEISKFTVQFDIPTLASEICAMNYGAHRMLSAMVHELRKRQSDYVDESHRKDASRPEHERLNLSDVYRRSVLADSLERLLNDGLTDIT